MKTIAFILPHFGKLDVTGYFPLFLASCGENQTVDFFVFTDDRTPYPYPPNVHVFYLTLEALRERIQALYGFPVTLDRPYQLCNFKIAYGEIFARELEGFDYWGYLDSDLILGDIRHFVTEEMLERYHKIYTHGHMTLYRNTLEVNTLYRQPHPLTGCNTDYRRSLSSGEIDGIDEWGSGGGINGIFLYHRKQVYDVYDFDDVAADRRGFVCALKRHSPPYQSMQPCCYQYRSGHLYRHGLAYGGIFTSEVLYAHFQKRSMSCRPEELDPSAYLIVPDRFLPDQEITADFLTSLPKDGIRWPYFRWRVKNFMARRCRRLRHPSA